MLAVAGEFLKKVNNDIYLNTLYQGFRYQQKPVYQPKFR